MEGIQALVFLIGNIYRCNKNKLRYCECATMGYTTRAMSKVSRTTYRVVVIAPDHYVSRISVLAVLSDRDQRFH